MRRKIIVIHRCKCGCGERVNPGRIFINGHQSRGRFISKETRQKASNSLIGRKRPIRTLEHSKKISAALKGHEVSEETKKRISEVNKGRVLSEEHKKKISDRFRKLGINKGREVSDKTKKLLSEINKGKTLSKEVKAKISRINKGRVLSEETKKRISIGNKGRSFSDKHKENISKANRGKRRTKEMREKQSKSTTERYLEGEVNFNCGYFFSIKNNKKIHYRSSYELVAYEILEQLSKVESYEVEPFSIPYEFKGHNHYTIPDILITYIDGTKELIEVKPEYKLDWDDEKAKFVAMEEYAVNKGYPFTIWTEKELNIVH